MKLTVSPAASANAAKTVEQLMPEVRKLQPMRAASDAKAGGATKKDANSSNAHKADSSAVQPSGKGPAPVQSSNAKVTPVTPNKPEPIKTDTQKRKHPGKLDIAAAVKQDEAVDALSPTPGEAEKRNISQVQSASSQPESPIAASPAVKSAPRTLRVVPTPKAETPPTAPFATPKEPSPAATKLPSRQPSVASVNLPGTPSSEPISISDTISMTSTSQSRANSPPPPSGPSKVGSAPVRAKTKNQMKKERQERAKAIEEEKSTVEEVVNPAADEPAQEAIVSRKKKAKRAKEPRARTKAPVPTATGESTPTASRPASPQPGPAVEAPWTIEQPPKEAKSFKPSTPTAPAPTIQPLPTQLPGEPSPPPTPTLTAAQLLAEIKATAPELQKCIDSLFRSPASNHHKPNQNILPKDLANPASWKQDYKVNLTKNEVDALLKGTVPAITYGSEDGRIWNRGMVTGSGAHLRALTEELEMRFLELERAIGELPDELRYHPSKPQNEMKFPSIDLEGLKRQFENVSGRGVSVMEQMVQDGSTMKKGAFLVDEASKYINEFVMPPATPPPSNVRAQQAGAGAQNEPVVLSVDIAERQLSEARRVADERDGALKKAMKKNRKLFGLG